MSMALRHALLISKLADFAEASVLPEFLTLTCQAYHLLIC